MVVRERKYLGSRMMHPVRDPKYLESREVDGDWSANENILGPG